MKNKYPDKIKNFVMNLFEIRNTKWHKFKNLADTIERTKQSGSAISWNTEFRGIYFDAIIDINKPACPYIIVVKCIESKELVAPKQVEDFINQAQQVEASIAVLASESGFEDECVELYKYEFIRLFTLETINQTSPEVLTNVFNLILNQYDFRFLMTNGRFFGFPDEPGILKSFMQDMKIEGTEISTNPEGLVNQLRTDTYKTASGITKEYRFDFPKGTVLIHPNTLQKIPIVRFIFNYRLFTAIDLEDPTAYKESPYLIDNLIEEELLKRNSEVDLSKIETGFNTTLQAKKYYYNPKLQFSYYCEEVKKGESVLVLVESYQAEQLLQTRFVMSNSQSNQFIEITNQAEIKRLSELYENFAVSDRNLTGRFKAFLKTVENTECIDELQLTREQENANKADYFFNNREIIGELKSLETDSSHKIQKIVDKYSKRADFPLFFGRVDFQRLIEKFSDREKINREVVDAVSKSIEGIIEKANRQIRATKQTFSLPEAGGLLIILNDLVYSLPPDIISYRINRTLNKRTPTGEPRFPFVSAVVVFHTAHYIQVNPELQAHPILSIRNTSSQSQTVEDFVEEFIPKWTKFEGIPLLNSKLENLDLKFSKTNDPRAKKKNQ